MMIKVEWKEFHYTETGHVIQFIVRTHGDIEGIIILPNGKLTNKKLHELKVVEV